ncbi:hypothetical protein, unlikely [Trypanosoma brucei gambiense DAL972]|uniref:Uncharacterized protein n=1 Tax=Trypanosoma brucei gambiense (strain MHOM/CI/86/DAL972) TaxID=679716 RepID=C9ZNI0_TRYB9|nr:hypothetical protein, unlikely [Trypanosoma brucei gambiense DAL972]CBH10958.1 hypothetical protein, unlikely [Trypanosoma brucei gambiense DAL972]|eukprot:XP_011773245.1 hypothetical protein, unlikely [Trypanosoma brucei gambiense DAL972]
MARFLPRSVMQPHWRMLYSCGKKKTPTSPRLYTTLFPATIMTQRPLHKSPHGPTALTGICIKWGSRTQKKKTAGPQKHMPTGPCKKKNHRHTPRSTPNPNPPASQITKVSSQRHPYVHS